ncbi:hypothetical protein LTR17_000529 [Elasticomyces elasticus]|nr:hypothetical protein LTR17_000529 [Elasticomyces elasticus]
MSVSSDPELDISASWAEREVVFTEEKGTGQLGAQRNNGDDLRPKITDHRNVVGQRVYASVNKVRWGTYEGNTACLLVMRFRFYYGKSLFRLRKADITVCFNNYRRASEQTRSIPDARSDPIVCVYSPSHVRGTPTEDEIETHWEIAARCSVNVGPVSVGPEASRGGSSRMKVEHAVEIAGEDMPEGDKDYPNTVIFSIDENEKVTKGIPKELYFGIVVQHEGLLQAEILSSIRDATALPWTKDDPIILQPGKEFGRCTPSLSSKFDEWTDDDWTQLVPYIEESANVKQGRTR